MVETGVDLRLLRPSTHSPMRVTYLTDIGSPFRVIARITGCIICPPAAIHHDISHTRIGCISVWNLSLLFFRFFYFRKGRLHVVSRGYKHVWCTPAFVWRYVQFNLVITMKNVNGESSLFSLLSLQMHLRFWLKSLRLSPELRRWSWAVCQPICSSLPILCPQQLLEPWGSLKQTLLMAEPSLTLECFVLNRYRQIRKPLWPNQPRPQNKYPQYWTNHTLITALLCGTLFKPGTKNIEGGLTYTLMLDLLGIFSWFHLLT